MASLYSMKPRFQSLLRPLTCWLARCGVTPNQITLSAMLLCCCGGMSLALAPDARWALLLVPLLLLVRMALNAIDGMLAREHHMQSDLGLLLNELGDVFSDAVLYLPFGLVAGVSAPMVVIIVILATISELAGVCATQIGSVRRYDGPLGKSDRAVLFGALGLLLGCGIAPGPWVDALLALAVPLLGLTILNRCRRALQSR